MLAPRCVFVLLLLLNSGNTWAQTQSAVVTDTTTRAFALQREPRGAAESARLANRPIVEVVDVYSLSSKRRDTLQLGDHVVMQARGLREALGYYKRRQEDLRLYIDSVVLPIEPIQLDTVHNASIATVRFVLRRDAATEPTWQLFYEVWRKLEHPAQIGIGFQSGQLGSLFPTRDKIYLQLVRRNALAVGTGVIVALFLGLLFMARRSNLVRSDVIRGQLTATPDSPSIQLISKEYETVPFSLSKVQLVFWTFPIFSAYLLCYLVTGELTTLPGSLLALLGVSLGSNVFSRSLTLEQVKTEGPPYINDYSKGFWRDILAEGTRYSIARIQFLLFNLLIGFYFIRYVTKLWNLPDLDDGLLGLISISATGFLFGKSQEFKDPVGQMTISPTPIPAGAAPPAVALHPAPNTTVAPSPSPLTQAVGANGTPP